MTYHFHVYNGTQIVPDREGSRICDPEAVRDEVRAIARELLQDGFRAGQDRLRWRLSVVDAAGATIADYTLPHAAI